MNSRMMVRQLMLLVVVFGVFGAATYVHATTVDMEFLTVAPENNNDGHFYVYPYKFSIDGASSLTSLLCDDFNDDIYFGETWKANVWNVNDAAIHGQMTPSGSSLAGLNGQSKRKAYQEAAYLMQQLVLNPTESNAVNINHAIWALFSDTPYNAGVIFWFDDAKAHTGGSGELTDSAALAEFGAVSFYTPVPGTQMRDGQFWAGGPNDGQPQEFIGVPEPGSLALLGIGLIALAGVIRRKAL